jgi:hypothetical protein
MPNSYFRPKGTDSYVATELTEGPWSPGSQHGGPPSALLVRVIDQVPSSIPGPSRIARISVDILGPVPVAEVRTRGTLVRPGRSVELVRAELLADERLVMRAEAWRIRESTPFDAVVAPRLPVPPDPEGLTPWPPTWGGYSESIEWRFVSGGFGASGPASVWGRLRVPVVADEEPTPVQRVVAVADSGNGLSGVLDMRAWWFINTELTVHLFRLPVDEWVHVYAESHLDPAGIGTATTVVSDRHGPIGNGAQALMVGPRAG